MVMAAFAVLAAKLMHMEPEGKHARPSWKYTVQADIDRQTVQIFHTMNRPPWDDEPEWVQSARDWTVDTGSQPKWTEDEEDDRSWMEPDRSLLEWIREQRRAA